MNRKKRIEWILRGNIPPRSKLSLIEKVLEDLNYRKYEPTKTGSRPHNVYVRNGEVEQKVVPPISGRYVKIEYVKEIRENAKRILGVTS